MKPIQKELRGVTYILVPQLEVLKECQSCAFARRGDLCGEIGDECTFPENKNTVWEVKPERL